MKNTDIHQGETLKKLITEHNPPRVLLAEYMGITSQYLYKLYKEKTMRSVYFILACNFMKIDPAQYIETESALSSFLKQDAEEKKFQQKIIDAQGEALKMYKLNKIQEEKIHQLEEELETYKKRDTKDPK